MSAGNHFERRQRGGVLFWRHDQTAHRCFREDLWQFSRHASCGFAEGYN
jgi:hypothetical protein